jgi:hypothetical protein
MGGGFVTGWEYEMAITAIRASTQDNAAGTQVAQAANEDLAGALQAIAPVGNKTTWPEVSRTGLNIADSPSGGDMTIVGFGASGLIDCGNALTLQARATCDTAGKSLTGRVAFYSADPTPLCLGMSESITFSSDLALRLGASSGDFIASVTLVDCRAARKVKFKVDGVSGGSWSVYLRPI